MSTAPRFPGLSPLRHLRHLRRLCVPVATCMLVSALATSPRAASAAPPQPHFGPVAQVPGSTDWRTPAPRLDPGPPMPETIEPVAPATPRIEARPQDDARTLTVPAPGLAQPPPQLPADAGDPQGVERELQRLMRAAYAGGAYGATGPSAQAAWLLGLIHLHGAGVRIDTVLAEQWFSRAARRGLEPWAYAGLAWCKLEGCAGPADLPAAQQAIARLRATQPARSDYLAWLLASQQRPVQAAQPPLAQPQTQTPRAPELATLERAAAAGDVQANIERGIQAFAQQQPEQAAQFFRRAAPRSAAAAANLQEVARRTQEGGARADASRSGGVSADAAAALAQARKYHRGEGVPANFAEAIRFYRLAEQRGSAEARRMLALIASRPAPDGGFNVQWMQQLANADTGTPIPTVGVPVTAQVLQRDPTPLFDLLPPVWQRRVTPVGR